MSHPKRLVIVVNTAWMALKFRDRLIRTLREHGYHVTVLAQQDDSTDALRPLCDELISYKIDPRSTSVWTELATIADIHRHVRRIRPLAVLAFTIKPNIYACLVGRFQRVAVINNVTGLGSMHRLLGLKAWAMRTLYRTALSRSFRVFFQNAVDMQYMIDQQMVNPASASLLPGSGVDVDRYSLRAPRDPASPLRFTMVARLLKDKGVVEFADAARLIKRSSPEVQFDLWGILEASDARFVSAADIAGWEAEGILRFRGVARDALEAFADADCAVLPSYYPEGVPRTLLEAASMGLPAITADMPGCRDAVVHGQTGIVCPPRDAAALATGMRKIMDLGSDGRAEMGRQARRRVEAEFDECIVLKAYLSNIGLVEAVRHRQEAVADRG